MTNAVIITLSAIGVVVAGIYLFLKFGDIDATFSFFKTNGPLILTVAQVLGLFYAGMVGNIKLGVILTVTLLTTVFWGW